MSRYDVKISTRDLEAAADAGDDTDLGDGSSGKLAAIREEHGQGLPPPPSSSVNLSLDDVPSSIKFFDTSGRIRLSELPPPTKLPADLRDELARERKHESSGPARGESSNPPRKDSRGPGGSGGSFAPARRDSLGMRLLGGGKDSWADEIKQRRVAPSTLRDLIRSVTSWIILIALSIDILALLLEPLFVTRGGGPLQAAIATALASVGLALFIAIAAGAPVAATHGLVRFIGQRSGFTRHLWPLPLLALGWLIVANLAAHKLIHSRSLLEGQIILAVALGASLVAGTAITRIKRARLRVALGIAITLGALILNSVMSPVLKREPRDLLWFCTIFSFASIFYPLRRQVVAWPHEKVSLCFGYLAAGSVICLLAAPLISPDWRTYASSGGRFAPRMARFIREFVDLDSDGFSPVAWGTDCDDSHAGWSPACGELNDGQDRNCNGKTRPRNPTPAERGLAPAFGDADAFPHEVDRVVLITIDCFRNDAFREEYTPNLIKFAERGLRFEKLYSSGARTAMSLPFMLRGSLDAPTVAEIEGAEGISTTAVFAYRHNTLEKNVFEGFEDVERPPVMDQRMRAPEVTDRALADLRAPGHAQKHFLWAHYFDAHGPRSYRVLPDDLPKYPTMVGETDDESAIYLTELNFIDQHVGRLIDGLAAQGGLDHTMIIVTNDHGEGFGRHSVFEHGVSAFEAIIHSPGFIVAPGITPGTYHHVTAQRDIAATIVGAFGLVAKHPEVEKFGQSWLRLRADDGAKLHEFAFTYETTSPFEKWADAPMASLTDDRGKLSVSYVDGITRFYRLDSDPNEDYELTIRRPGEVAAYREKLELFRDIDSPPK